MPWIQEDELIDRTSELLEGNGEQVLSLLRQYAQSTGWDLVYSLTKHD